MASESGKRDAKQLWKLGVAKVQTQGKTVFRRLARRSEHERIPSRFATAWQKGFRGVLSAVMADILQDRMADPRNATDEAVSLEKRNSLFFLLLNILDNNRPFQTVSDIETTGAEDLEEPLWKIVKTRARRVDPRRDDLSATHVGMLAKAKEEGALAVAKVTRTLTEQRHGGFHAWHDFWSFYRELEKAAPPDVARSWRKELAALEKELDPGQLYRSSRPATQVSTMDDSEDSGSEVDYAPTAPESRRRPGLVEEYNPFMDRMPPTRCYESFQEHKKCRKVLKNVTLPQKSPLVLRTSGKEYRSPRRMGLSLSRLPEDRSKSLHFGAQTARGDFASLRCRLEHKQALIVSEPLRAMKTMASEEPSCRWPPGTEGWVKLRSYKEERGEVFEGENVMLASPVSYLKPEMPSVQAAPVRAFHRPWSAERGDRKVTSMQRYAKVCMDCGLQPQEAIVAFLGRQLAALDLRNLAYSDEDILALTAAFPARGLLESVDLGNSKVSDRSVCPMLQCVATRFADHLISIRLDGCIRIGRKTIQLLTRLIHGALPNLQRLDISGVSVSVCDYQKLANAMERHEQLREVSLARTGISPDLSTKVLPNLVRNSRIKKLDLGYNQFDPQAFTVLGNSLLKGSQIERLGLAKTASMLASLPMSGFLEQLPADKSLKFLDLSDNMLNESAALMLEYGLQTHPCIESLDVSTNPLGQSGLGSLARLLSSEKCPRLTEIVLEDVQASSEHDAAMGLFEVDPSGQYSLDLSLPNDRTCLRLLLSQLSDMGSRSQFIKSATLTAQKAMPAPYNVESFRRRKNIWNVPTSGVLDFVLNINDFLLKDQHEQCLYSPVVECMLLKRKRPLSLQRGIVILLKVCGLTGPIFDAFLMAILRYFHLSKEQVMAIFLNQGERAKEVVIRMLPSLMSPQALLLAARHTDAIKELQDFEKAAHDHLALNLENPTGHYSLRLDSLPSRVVVQNLMLLNRWQLHLWRKANYVDVSVDGKGKCMRNALLDGKFLSFGEVDWRLPSSGQFTFDFVALYRPPADAQPAAPEAWGQVLAALADLLAPKIRAGDQEDPAVQGQVAKVLWALRGLSSRVWLLTRQLRNLLCVFLNRRDRAEVLSSFFLRCVDWPINGKCCQPKFTRRHWKDLSVRLGYMNLFPYGQPEMSFHLLDLEQWEQRRCFHTLLRLAMHEDPVNIKNPMMDKDANPNAPAFQAFVAGIPVSWAELENIPLQGLIQCTYNCAVERQNLKARRRLAAAVGGWTNLPEVNFDLWSCLEDVPLEVLKVVMFMIRTWKSTDAAFSQLNTQPDNMLNHKEFVDGLARAGCCRSRRKKTMEKVRPAMSPKEDEEDPLQLEAISSVFRYLDTSHDGDISRKEFETLERVWRELHQSIYELKRDLEVFYGSLKEAFEAIDLDESGELSFAEFQKCVQATHFDGPVQEIFMFIDLNGDGEIDGQEFFTLEQYGHSPPLPDFTDHKMAKLQRLFR